jgi:hypothetical protein
MRIAVIYLAIGSSKAYDDGALRFCKTLRETDDCLDFDLVAMACNGTPSEKVRDALNEFNPVWFPYWGEGCDIGAHQTAANLIDHDFMICTSSHTYFHRKGWFRRLIDARFTLGQSLYGGMASYEQHRPHIRTNFFACDPKDLRSYPEVVNSRVKSLQFESQPNNFLGFMLGRGMTGYLVTWDGIYGPEDYRKPTNVFRRGDQSNCLVWDKHTDIFRDATPEQREITSALADGTL